MDELDVIAARYYDDPPADEWIENRVSRWIMPKIIGWCQGRTLEMGYGSGITTRMILAAGKNLDLVEGSEALALTAFDSCSTATFNTGPKYGGRVSGLLVEPWLIVHRALFEEFDPEPIYDTVLCLHVLEHVADPVGVLRRVRGWLKPGGRLIAVTPNADSLHRLVGSMMSGEPKDTLSDRDRLVGHVRVYDIDGLCDDVRAAGFGRVRRWGWFTKPVNNARMVDWPPEMIDALCEIGWDSSVYDCANVGVVARAV